MKKIFFIFLGLNFITEVLSAAEIGKLMIVRGQVEIMHAGKAQKAKVGLSVYEGDRVETQADSYVKIVMKDRNVLVVIEKTKLVVHQYKTAHNSKQVQINVEQGSARHSLKQKYEGQEEFYRVQTPRMVAGVRGTDFITEYDISNGDAVLCALEGKVSMNVVENGDMQADSVIVAAGNFVRLKKEEKAPHIIQTKPEWLKKVLKSHRLR